MSISMPRGPRVGVLCYSLTPATVELFDAVHFRLRAERGCLKAFCVAPAPCNARPAFDYEQPQHLPRCVVFGGLRGVIPESLPLAIGARTVLRLLAFSDVVLLFGIQGAPALLTALVGRITGKPLIAASQTMPLRHERRRMWLLRQLKRFILRSATWHIAQTITTCEVLQHMYGVAAERIELAPFTGGARTVIKLLEQARGRAAVRAEYGLSPEALVFLFVGTLIHLKGVDILVEAFARFAGRNPGSVLVLVGPDGAAGGQMTALREATRAGDLEGRVLMLGELPFPRVVELYKASDVFVLPTRKDTWAKVVVEAALVGLPSIVTDVAGVAGTVVLDGRSGLVVPADDVSALVDAMEKMTDRATRTRMGCNAREQANAFTDLDREADVYARLIFHLWRTTQASEKKDGCSWLGQSEM